MPTNDDIQSQSRAAAKGLNTLFKTTEGEALLALLERRFCKSFSNDHMARDVGRMDVVLFLKKLGETTHE